MLDFLLAVGTCIVIAFMILFIWFSCVVASRCDDDVVREEEKDVSKR